MTIGGENDKRGQDKRGFGLRPVAALMPGVIRPGFRRRSAAGARILGDWTEIVGPALAAAITPQKLAAGTLTLACSGPMGLELQHLSDQVVARINQHLGVSAVVRIRIVPRATPPIMTPPPRPPAVAQARNAVATFPQGALRDALERLGQLVLSRP